MTSIPRTLRLSGSEPYNLTPDKNFVSPDSKSLMALVDAVAEDRLLKLDSILLAESVLGDAVFANTLLLGAGWQAGGIPVSYDAIMRALELNGVAVEMNRHAFELGRYASHDLDAALALIKGTALDSEEILDLDALIERRAEFLTDYQDDALAQRYRALVEQVRQREMAIDEGLSVTNAVARYYFKVLAHKDEWEVARLYADRKFQETLRETFDGNLKLTFHIGGWPFGRKIANSNKIVKRPVGGWMMGAFKLMASVRGLRGTWLDPFKNSKEAKAARALIRQYEADVAKILELMDAANLEAAAGLATVPDLIRGYGHVREEHAARSATVRTQRLAELLGASAEDNLIAKAS